MHSPVTNSGAKGPLNISDVGPRFGSAKLAAGAPHIRAFCERVGVYAIRAALALAVLSALLLTAALPAQAQTERVLYNFTGGSDGKYPTSSLTFDAAGNLYGTTEDGGAFGYGTVFELSPNGSGGWNETVLYRFTGGADGAYPMYADVILDSAGNLYGTTETGGAYGWGVVFELSPVGGSWTETVLYSFANYYVGFPVGGLIMDRAGNLYGTTATVYAGGSVFELSPSGGGWTEQVIYGIDTEEGGLTMDAAGNIFGLSYSVDSKGWTVFELAPNGKGGWNPTVIHTFNSPKGTLVLDQAGNLYGTTTSGGGHGFGTVYRLSPGEDGKWKLKILYAFKDQDGDGGLPYAGIVFDAAGNIYGTTLGGGEFGEGTVFELAAVGKDKYQEKILWSFNGTDGYEPRNSLILDNAGNLYGTIESGGPSGYGIVFEVTGLAAVTTTTLTSAPNPSTYGQAVTFTAVVTPAPPNGETVSFMKGKTVLGTGTLSGGSASFTTSTLKVGTTAVKAVYGGDSNFAGSTSNTVKQVVEKAK